MKDALEVIARLGVSGGVGFLLGWLMVYWIEPATKGGVALLIILSVVFCTTIGGILSKFIGSSDQKDEDVDEKKLSTGKTQSNNPKKEKAPSDSWLC